MPRLLFLFAVCLFAGCRDSRPDAAIIPPWDGELSEKIPMPIRGALEECGQLELLSLDARYRDSDAPKEFLRRKVIGKTVIEDPTVRDLILAALDYGASFDELDMPDCFEPRHAMRLEHEAKSYYLTICFECNQVFVFVDDAKDLQQRFYVKADPEWIFDEVLKSANVPTAPKNTSLQE